MAWIWFSPLMFVGYQHLATLLSNMSNLCHFFLALRILHVVDVFDRYDKDDSIKSAERTRRASASNSQIVYHLSEGRSIPDWKKFIKLKKQAGVDNFPWWVYYRSLLPLKVGQTDFLVGTFSNPEIVKRVSAGHVENCFDMHSSHEEADTRMILHAIFADQQFKEQKVKGRIVIIIKCSDTDVLVLCVHFFPKLESTEQMWFLIQSQM